MLTRITTAIFCSVIFSNSSVSLGDELKFGSPSPEFSGAMMRGEPIDGITNGTIYVVEFGGTKCAPCIKFIPKMNALQERYPNVVFVSVFCESLETVEPFMDGPGKAMRVRVATDETGRMREEWLDAAGLQAIPQAFIIDRSGHLAWFGYPDERDFGEVLKRVVEGSYDGRLEFMRVELNRKKEERRRERFRKLEKMDDLAVRAHACATPQESIALIDKALPEFADVQQRIFLSILKLHFYRTVPQSRERAYQHALLMAVEATREPNSLYYISACQSMLSHFEHALPDNRDSRLVDLALVLLLDETARANDVEPNSDRDIKYQIKRLVAIANAHRLRGELPRALERLRKAVVVTRKRELEKKPEWWLDKHKKTLSRLESKLTTWKEEGKARRPPQ